MKKCVICRQKILEDRERWVKMTDFDCGVKVGTTYYHLECWRERFKITNSKRKKQMYAQTMEAIKNIKDNLGKGGMVVAQ